MISEWQTYLRWILVGIVLAFAVSPRQQAQAATDFASLAAAIEAANSGQSEVTIALARDIRLVDALPVIKGALTIEGKGHSLGGNGERRIFDIAGGNLTISEVTLADGNAMTGGAIRVRNGGAAQISRVVFRQNQAAWGGAIAISSPESQLNISVSSFINNHASQDGGAIISDGGHISIGASSFQDNTSQRDGGAIDAHKGAIEVLNSSFIGNRAAESGGAIILHSAELSLTHVTLVHNQAKEGGGILQLGGALKLRNSIIAGSRAGKDCVGIPDQNVGNLIQDWSCNAAFGGDPLLAELSGMPGHHEPLDGSPAVDRATAEFCPRHDQLGNARPLGGGCDIGAIESASAQASAEAPRRTNCSLADHIRAANTNRAVGNCPAGTSHDIISLSEDIILYEALPAIRGTITIEGNGHSISGAGKFRIFDISSRPLTLKNLTLADGFSAGQGGAIRLRNGGQLHARKVSFRDNWAKQGGVIAMLSADVAVSIENSQFLHNAAELQGGVFLISGGTASISGSSFIDNRSERAWGGVFHARGSRLSVRNSSFSGNRALAGGVLAQLSGQSSLRHVTMVDNRSDYLGGDALYRHGGAIRLRNSIVHNRGAIEDCSGGLTASAGNLSVDGSCAATPADKPMLGALSGAPGYFPLKEGSPAIDAALAEFCPAVDQLGNARPIGEACDIGAVETAAKAAAKPIVPPPPCPLYDQIIAANTDAPSGGCPAGDGHDVIIFSEDIVLEAPLPRITSAITMEGNGRSISGDKRFQIFNVVGGALTIKDLTLIDGYVPANAIGGAIQIQDGATLIVNDASFVGNSAKEGGAIASYSPGDQLIITRSSFRDNRALGHGAGGAILVGEGGHAEIRQSSFVGNYSDHVGGAIASWHHGAMQISNSTFSRNQAREGGAVYADGSLSSFTQVTMLGNLASSGRGHAIALFDERPGHVQLRNSIIHSDYSSGQICSSVRLTGSGGNLLSDESCGAAASDDPQLGKLDGLPGAHPILSASPAIDGGDPRFCLDSDQLGRTRNHGAGCDIGAIEYSGS